MCMHVLCVHVSVVQVCPEGCARLPAFTRAQLPYSVFTTVLSKSATLAQPALVCPLHSHCQGAPAGMGVGGGRKDQGTDTGMSLPVSPCYLQNPIKPQKEGQVGEYYLRLLLP